MESSKLKIDGYIEICLTCYVFIYIHWVHPGKTLPLLFYGSSENCREIKNYLN